MADHGLALLTVVLAWWFSTGAILYLGGLNRRTFPFSMIAATLALGGAIVILFLTASAVTTMNVYLAFLAALVVWGWIEMSFLFGLITGPRTSPCPPDARGWRRFRLATETLIYHELMIVCAAISIVALTWEAPNQTGTLTFLILTAMRLSAKLNIFLGVPNLAHEMLPPRLGYLKSYFRRRRFNFVFPLSVALSVWGAFTVGGIAFSGTASGAEATGAMLLLSILLLGLLEHFFMVLPIQDSALWRWAMTAHAAPAGERRDPPRP